MAMSTADDLYQAITVAVLTFCRPTELKRCLNSILERGQPGPTAAWKLGEIIVIDNDPEGSARSVVGAYADEAGEIPIRYLNETRPGVGWARNRAMDEAHCRVMVFIDDDEIVGENWPGGLIDTMNSTGAAMVGGPVDTEFEVAPPQWVIDGAFFDRPNPLHHSRQLWLRSGNLAIDLEAVGSRGLRFDPQYQQGEDVHFTRRASRAGLDLRWSAFGSVTEFVGPERLSEDWRIDRERLTRREWTRCELELDGSPRQQLMAGTKAIGLGLIGGYQILKGVVGRSKAVTMHGRVNLARARGRVEALASAARSPRSSTT